MLPDRVSNPGPLTYESGALPIALRGPADYEEWTDDLWFYIIFYNITGMSGKLRKLREGPQLMLLELVARPVCLYLILWAIKYV